MNRGYVSQGMEEATYTTKELKKMYGDLEKPLQNQEREVEEQEEDEDQPQNQANSKANKKK